MRLGLLLTVVMQLYLLFRETRQHQRELLRYQEMQNEMLQMRVSIMVSQIQPHFLYNSLTSIAQLCEKEPSKAKKATIEFSEYLRRNMNSLKGKAPVPFESELKHLETYFSLEKMRFEDEPYDLKQQAYIQKIISAMMKSLKKCGAGDAVFKKYNSLSVDVSKLDCDYYRFAELDAGAVNAYSSEYMSQYYWADFMLDDY